MNTRVDRLSSVVEACAALLDQESHLRNERISALLDAVSVLQQESADRRIQRLALHLRELQAQLQRFDQTARVEMVEKLRGEIAAFAPAQGDGRLAGMLSALLDMPAPPAMNRFCDAVLDQALAATGAERGLILFYLPESTEADVVAARRFRTTHLSTCEYDFSRTLLHEVLERGTALLVDDVAHDPAYAREISVREFQIRSVVIVPLQHQRRTIGALYLENHSRIGAFGDGDLHLLQQLARFAVFFLDHARLLPVLFAHGRRVFFDASKAAKEFLGQHPQILAIQALIQRIADSPATVLIEGESGTGKELVARALHFQSRRHDHPFVAINCAAIPENLMESQLFGHEKGAFTGATERYIGRIEQGNGGTIFLDEVSELPHALQAKLLRFLQGNEIERVGGRETIHVEVRIVAATSRDLKAMMAAGTFQEALYYRLNVIPLRLPALRDRREDILLLVEHFAGKYSAIYQKKVTVDPEVAEQLTQHPLPGNVRELENLVHRLVALSPGDSIGLVDLPKEYLEVTSQRVSLAKHPLHRLLATPPANLDELRRRRDEVRNILADQERQLIEKAIDEAGGNLSSAADRLGVHRVTLYKMLKREKRGKNQNRG